VWLSVKRPAPRARVFAPGSPSGVAGPPAAISPGYCCPDLFVIDRSCGCLCDSGFVRRFLGSDAAAGAGLWGCGWGSGGAGELRHGGGVRGYEMDDVTDLGFRYAQIRGIRLMLGILSYCYLRLGFCCIFKSFDN